jgi:hypothetical protein
MGEAIDNFLGSIQISFQQSQEKCDAGQDLAIQTEVYRHPIEDTEIKQASEDYFAMLATQTYSLNNLVKWRQEVSGLVQTLRSLATCYRTSLPPTRPMTAEITALEQQTTELHTANALFLDCELETIFQETLYVTRTKLAEINTLRSRALKLQYRVEQLEKIDMNSGMGKALKVAGGENWLANTRAELAVAKPAFLTAVPAFQGKFDSLRKQAFARVENLQKQLLQRVANLDRQSKPSDKIEDGDLRKILAVYDPKPK